MPEEKTSKKILLVEDEALLALTEQNQLQAKGYSVSHLCSGEDAVDAVSSGADFDLVLMDIDLGDGMDGTECARRILEIRDLPVVFLSSHTEPEVVEKTEKITSYGYVVKNSGITVYDASIKMAFKLHAEKRKVQQKQEELVRANSRIFASNRDLKEKNRLLVEKDERLRRNDDLLRVRIDRILNPETDISDISVEEIIDTESLQDVMDDLYKFTGMVSAFLDLKGNILIATGWQDICTRFHRVNEITSAYCTESDLHLSGNLKPGDVIDYKCRNGLWDVVTPLFIGEKHVANIFTGQFFYDDDVVDESFFIRQAEMYGFDRKEYLEALRRVPAYSREHVNDLMTFLVKYFRLVSDLGYSNLRLAKESAEHQKSRKQLALDEVQIRRQLEEKETILREVHHRIKNNILNIESLLKLQMDSVGSIESRAVLQETIGRVTGMRQLYEKMMIGDSFSEVSVRDYLNDLLPAIRDFYSDTIDADIKTDIDDFNLDVKTLFIIGLVVNELITNAMKYAFGDMDDCRIGLSLHKSGDEVLMEVRDNGRGLPEGFDLKEGAGFGFQLIDMMVNQLQGEYSLESDNGVNCAVRFRIQR